MSVYTFNIAMRFRSAFLHLICSWKRLWKQHLIRSYPGHLIVKFKIFLHANFSLWFCIAFLHFANLTFRLSKFCKMQKRYKKRTKNRACKLILNLTIRYLEFFNVARITSQELEIKRINFFPNVKLKLNKLKLNKLVPSTLANNSNFV
jgi:hypothetical protein